MIQPFRGIVTALCRCGPGQSMPSSRHKGTEETEAMDKPLNKQQMERYSRHVLLPEVGTGGQQRLLQARVLIIGAGGLGSPVAWYLAAAGTGTLGICDFDVIDRSNLQRQILHQDAGVGKPKVESAVTTLQAFNPDIRIVPHPHPVREDNVMALIKPYDLIIDGSDNFTTRYLVNDACVLQKKINIHGAISRFEGQASVFGPGGPCYRCLFPEPPPADAAPNCSEAGVLGVLPGMIGMVQATEAIKALLQLGDSLMGHLLVYDALAMSFDKFTVPPAEDCPACGRNPRIHRPEAIPAVCRTETAVPSITPGQLQQAMEQDQDLVLLDVRSHEERAICRIEPSLHIPLPELPERLAEIPEDRTLVVYCRSGARSRQACEQLQNAGRSPKNLPGGILAWAAEIDPAMPRY